MELAADRPLVVATGFVELRLRFPSRVLQETLAEGFGPLASLGFGPAESGSLEFLLVNLLLFHDSLGVRDAARLLAQAESWNLAINSPSVLLSSTRPANSTSMIRSSSLLNASSTSPIGTPR